MASLVVIVKLRHMQLPYGDVFLLKRYKLFYALVKVQLYSFFNLWARWEWVVTACLDGYGKSRSPQGFDLQTDQPLASRYTLYAIPAS